jgi:hypothetical protein
MRTRLSPCAWVCAVALCLACSSCTLFRPSFEAPVATFVTTPETTGDLADRLAPQHPRIEHFIAKMAVVASGKGIRGKQKITLYVLCRVPDQIVLKADHRRAGEVFRITQNGNGAAVYLPREGEFYRGTVDELREHPDVLFGVRPADMARILLIGQDVVDLLQAVPSETPLPASPVGAAHWVIATAPDTDRRETYAVRQADGLVEAITVFNNENKRHARISYERYDLFEGILFPSRFRLISDRSDLHLLFEVETVSFERGPSENILRLESPSGSGIVERSFSDWFTRRSDVIESE